MLVDARSFFSLVSFCCAFFYCCGPFLVTHDLNVSLFSFMTGFNSNWFICVGFINSSMFLSSHACTKLHMKTESLDF
jgi:hypothetical protein